MAFRKLIGLLFVPTRIHIEKNIPFSTSLFEPTTFWSVILIISILIFMFWARRRYYSCFFGLAWFFLSLIPMANIVPINATLADHWVYLPCCGFFLAIIGLISDFLKKGNLNISKKLRILAVTIYSVVILIFSALTIRQNTFWQDPVKFYRKVLEYAPESFRAHNELGIIYLDQKQYRQAIKEFEASLKIKPNFDQAYDNLGVALDFSGEFEAAITAHKKSIEINPHNIKAYNNLGNAYISAKRFDEAISTYKHALKLNPGFKGAYNNLGVAYYEQGMYREAKKIWEKALELDPNFTTILNNLKALEPLLKEQN